VKIAESILKVRGQRPRSHYKCVSVRTAEAYILTMWRRGSLGHIRVM